MSDAVIVLATWLVAYLLHSTVLLGGAWLVERLKLTRAPAACEFIWRVALVGALVTTTTQLGIEALDVPRPNFLPMARTLVLRAPHSELPAMDASTAEAFGEETSAGTTRAASPSVADAPAGPALSAEAPATQTPAATPHTPGLAQRAAASWPYALCALWLLASAVVAVRFGVLAWFARRELEGRTTGTGLPLSERLRKLCTSIASAVPRLTVSSKLASPVSLPNGEICVPAWVMTDLTPTQQDALLAHELAHLRRRDPQWLLATRFLHVLLIGQPLNGLARRRLAALAELEADAWAARAVRDPRALAECLAACAERVAPARVALLGTAMSGRSSLVERVHRLLDGLHLQAGRISRATRVAALVALVAVVVMLPVLVVHAGDGPGRDFSLWRSRHGHNVRTEVTSPGYSMTGSIHGKVEYNDAGIAIASMTAGSTFELEETRDGVTHRITLESRDGKTIHRRYWLDGTEQPFDAEGEAWLTTAIPALQRAGMDPQDRVDQLLKRGGVGAVLDDMAALDNDYLRSRFVAALIAARDLSGPEFERVLQYAGRIESAYERGTALQAALAQAREPGRQTALLTAAIGMKGDYETAELLTRAAGRLDAAPEPWDAWFAVAGGIKSGYDLRRSYAALLKNDSAPSAAVARVLADAGARFESDYDLGEVLTGSLPRVDADPALITAYVSAAREIDEGYTRGQALDALVHRTTLDVTGCGQVLDAIATIGGDYERSQALISLARHMPGEPGLLARYRDVAGSLSDYQRGQAEKALDHLAR